MSIISFIDKVCVQTAVYWAPGTLTGYGDTRSWTCMEVKVRWDDETELITNHYGKEVVSNAQIMVNANLDPEGMIYLGTKASLSAQQQSNPLLVTKAFPIQKINKTPLFKSSTKFVYTVFV